MAVQLMRGETPRIDLKSFDRLDLGAITNLVAFCAAVKGGHISSSSSSALIFVDVPEDPRVLDYLYQTGFFHFTQYVELLGEIIARATEFAKEEDKVNSWRRDDLKYPYMPFRIVVRPVPGRVSQDDFDNACKNFLESLTSKFFSALVDHLGFSIERAETFWLPNKEIVENIHKHSKSWGVGAIQCLKGRVLICYCDIGSGMKKTLEPYKDEIEKTLGKKWSDCTAIEAAFKEGITCLPGKSRGIGLHDVSTYVSACGGTIECRSGRGKVVFSSKGNPHHYEVDYIPGVQYRIELPAHRRTSL